MYAVFRKYRFSPELMKYVGLKFDITNPSHLLPVLMSAMYITIFLTLLLKEDLVVGRERSYNYTNPAIVDGCAEKSLNKSINFIILLYITKSLLFMQHFHESVQSLYGRFHSIFSKLLIVFQRSYGLTIV